MVRGGVSGWDVTDDREIAFFRKNCIWFGAGEMNVLTFFFLVMRQLGNSFHSGGKGVWMGFCSSYVCVVLLWKDRKDKDDGCQV